jgi:hypothetical protein
VDCVMFLCIYVCFKKPREVDRFLKIKSIKINFPS